MTDVPMTPPPATAAAALLDTHQQFDYPVPAPRVFAALTEGIGMWWSQRLHPEARSQLEPVPGGQWRQLWSNGGALLGTISHIEVPYRIRIVGSLAMSTPAVNVLEWLLEPLESGGTRLHVVHRAWGLFDGPTAASYQGMWQDTFGTALAQYLSR